MSDTNDSGTLVPFENAEFRLDITTHDADGFRVPAEQVAHALNTRGRDLVRFIPDAEKGRALVRTPGGDQEAWYLTEAGFYRAIGQRQTGRIEDADIRARVERFQAWVYREVLPSIRKTGSYDLAPASPEEQMALGLIAAQKMLAEKDERIAELEPKAALADDFLIAEGGARLVGQVAKLIGWKEKDLRRWLIDEKLVFVRHSPCGAIQYNFYAEFAHHFQARETIVNHTWGTCTHYTLYILPRGVELIRKRITRTAVSSQLAPLTFDGESK